MKAIILAAGLGARLGNLTKETNKCLLPVDRIGSMTVLDLQLEALRKVGIRDRDVVIVVGHCYHEIATSHQNNSFIYNLRYAERNNAYSLSLARKCLAHGAIVLNSDVVITNLHEDLQDMINMVSFDKAFVNILFRDGPTDEEDMKVSGVVDYSEGDHCVECAVHEIKKVMKKNYPVLGEFCGVSGFSPIAGMATAHAIDLDYSLNSYKGMWYEDVFQRMIDSGVDFAGVRMKEGHKYCEIDTPEDLDKARRMIESP